MQTMTLIAEILLLGLVHTETSATCACSTQQNLAQYELIHKTDITTEKTGSITLKCRDSITAEELTLNEIKFFLNRSSAADCSLRERGDIRVVEVGNTGIRFNLTRKYDGNYTCGKRVDCSCANVTESMPKTLISFQTIIPLLPSSQTNFTAISGDKVVLSCPIEPGALLQQYSVRWKKDNRAIADYISILNVTDSRYNIDRANYSLIINFVNISDTSADYQCELTVENPKTKAKQILQPSPPLSLSLEVIENETMGYPTVSTTDDHETPTSTDSSTIVITSESFMYYIINTITVIFFIF